MLNKIMENFNWEFEKKKQIYQDNYIYDKEDPYQKKEFIRNEYINQFYINRRRKGVFMNNF